MNQYPELDARTTSNDFIDEYYATHDGAPISNTVFTLIEELSTNISEINVLITRQLSKHDAVHIEMDQEKMDLENEIVKLRVNADTAANELNELIAQHTIDISHKIAELDISNDAKKVLEAEFETANNIFVHTIQEKADASDRIINTMSKMIRTQEDQIIELLKRSGKQDTELKSKLQQLVNTTDKMKAHPDLTKEPGVGGKKRKKSNRKKSKLTRRKFRK